MYIKNAHASTVQHLSWLAHGLHFAFLVGAWGYGSNAMEEKSRGELMLYRMD